MRFTTLLVLNFYRCILGPLLSFLCLSLGVRTCCIYPETCSHFAMRQFKEEPSLIQAFWSVFKRLISCGPWANLR